MGQAGKVGESPPVHGFWTVGMEKLKEKVPRSMDLGVWVARHGLRVEDGVLSGGKCVEMWELKPVYTTESPPVHGFGEKVPRSTGSRGTVAGPELDRPFRESGSRIPLGKASWATTLLKTSRALERFHFAQKFYKSPGPWNQPQDSPQDIPFEPTTPS